MQSLWMLAAAALFTAMAVCVKYAVNYYSLGEILLARSLVATVMVAIYAIATGRRLFSEHWRAHARRAACGTFSMGVWYHTLGVLPMAVSVTLNYTSPLFLGAFTAIGAWRNKQGGASLKLYAPVGLGFIGVILLLRPDASDAQVWPILLGLFAASMAAVAFLDVKGLIRLNEPEWRLVFYFSLYSSVFALIPLVLGSPTFNASAVGLLLLFCIGTFGGLGQLAVSRAFGRGNVLASAALQYSSVAFSALLGLVLWGEKLHWQSLVGIFVISVAGVLAIVFTKRLAAAE